MEVKEEVKQFNRMNGNISFTEKDMLKYLIMRQEKLYDKLDNKVDKKTFFAVLTFLILLITALKFI